MRGGRRIDKSWSRIVVRGEISLGLIVDRRLSDIAVSRGRIEFQRG